MITSSEGCPIQFGQLCYTYCNNFMFHGVLDVSTETNNIVIHNIRFGIEFEVDLLNEIHTFTGLELLSLPKDDLDIYLNYLHGV